MSKAGIPTVKFDASRVTATVKADIKKNILLLDEIDRAHVDQVYEAALRSILAGRDMSMLYNILVQMCGVTKRRAAEIARLTTNNASSLMDRERLKSLGIKQVLWIYSGAPCEVNPKKPTVQENQQNAAHIAASGKTFDVRKGMFLGGKWTWPGVEPGCKCVLRPVIAGFS